MANENYKHNINGDYYFPMEIKDDADREYAHAAGLVITRTRLGNRVIEAIMIPCKRVAYDSRGREVYLETPTEEQREIYLSYIRDELKITRIEAIRKELASNTKHSDERQSALDILLRVKEELCEIRKMIK